MLLHCNASFASSAQVNPKIEELKKKIRAIQLAESRAARKARNRAIYLLGAVASRDPQLVTTLVQKMEARDRAHIATVFPTTQPKPQRLEESL